MLKTAVKTIVEAPKSFTDVLYLTNQPCIPVEIRQLFKQKKVSYSKFLVEDFRRISHRLDLIGTVIIDTQSLVGSQQQNSARVIETLEMKNIGVILLNNRIEFPVRSFSLTPSRTSFSLISNIASVSIDELWVRISVNLAYRKKGSEIFVKPADPPRQTQNVYRNRLAEQLRIGETLVGNLAEQLRMAGQVQHDFLPTHLPDTDSLHWATTFLPAEWVSGDIYDVARLDEQHIGFYVADVVGHGMPAALLTMFVKQALVMRQTIGEQYKIFSPTEVMTSLNLRMSEQKLSGYQFATCCYCLLNIETLELTFSRAGHPYPILIRDNQPQNLEVQGPLLGIFEKAEYPQQTVQLQPGDKLMLYSDGAEPFISFIDSYDELTGHEFKQEYHEIKDLHLDEMIEKFNVVIRNKKIKASEIDDITLIGLEIVEPNSGSPD